ncbi:hypothetical protein ScPMuIL_003611 [Solemya velum]
MAALTRSICRSVKFSSNFRPLSNSKVYASSAVGSADEVTHTGQVWEKDDYRRVRFMDKQKMVNKDFAIDLIAADQTPPKSILTWTSQTLGYVTIRGGSLYRNSFMMLQNMDPL